MKPVRSRRVRHLRLQVDDYEYDFDYAEVPKRELTEAEQLIAAKEKSLREPGGGGGGAGSGDAWPAPAPPPQQQHQRHLVRGLSGGVGGLGARSSRRAARLRGPLPRRLRLVLPGWCCLA